MEYICNEKLTISMTCCWTMPSMIVVVSAAASPVSPDTNIIYERDISIAYKLSRVVLHEL